MRFTGLIAAAAVLLWGAASPAAAQSGEPSPDYLIACNQYGSGYYRFHDSTVCFHADTGQTLPALYYDPTEIGLTELAARAAAFEEAARAALGGVAMNLAMPTPMLPSDQRFAFGVNWGTYEGQHAVGLTGALAVGNTAALTAGAGMGFGQRNFAFRGGLQLDF
ncbi:MAG: hypothetical protein AB7O56_08715 [Bauldia sp.]